MLPFLKNKLEGSASGPVETIEREPDEGAEQFDLLDAVAEDMLTAIETKDKKLLKSALEALLEHIQEEDKEQDSLTT
jgi:hypothetical protein